jgi:hypothetical protein
LQDKAQVVEDRLVDILMVVNRRPRIDHTLVVVADRLLVVQDIQAVIGTFGKMSGVGTHAVGGTAVVVVVLAVEDMGLEAVVEKILVHRWD